MKMKKTFGNKGQSLVETAFVLPIIILIFMSIIEFGMMFNNYLIVSNASREGARSAAVGKSDSEIIDIVESVAATLDIAKLTVTITPNVANRSKGDEVTVDVRYSYNLITPVIAAIVSGTVDLNGKTVMRME